MVNDLVKEMFEEYFEYDPESPSGLRWKVNRYRGKGNSLLVKAGDVAGGIRGCSKKSNYKRWVVGLNGKLHIVHRVIYCMYHGSLSSNYEVDHIDGNSLNNNIENLRVVTRETNRRNSKKQKNNKTGVTGVRTFICNKTGNVHIKAFWKENGKYKSKSFSVNKYGYDLAFELACEYREKAISKLNEKGYGYTERHGQV